MNRQELDVLHLVATNRRRGAEVYAHALVRILSSRGLAQKVLVLRYAEGGLAFPDEPSGALVRPDGTGLIAQILSVRRLIRASAPKVIYCHGAQMTKLAIMATLWLSPRPKIVTRKIGATAAWIGSMRYVRLAWNRWVYARVDLCLAMGARLRSELELLLRVPANKIVTTRNFRDPAPYIAACTERERQSAVLRMVSVGALSAEKNHGLMLRCVRQLLDRGVAVELHIVGDGPLRSDLVRDIARMGLSDHVVMHGAQSDVSGYLLASDIFLLCSTTEGVPGVLIEAAFAGLAIACWDVGDVSEVVDHHTAMIAPFGDESALLDGIEALARDVGRRQLLGRAARERALGSFTEVRVLEDHAVLFQRLLGWRVPWSEGGAS